MLGFKKATVRGEESSIEELLTRGVSEVIDKELLRKKLLNGEQLRIKLGIDPTSPDIHIGRAVLLLKLRAFQELGHTIVLIIGDFTGVIGDTSDKESERPMLNAETVRENAKTYFEQAGKLLDMRTVEKRHNSEWLAKLSYKEIGEHADKFSVADFIARDNIKKRLEKGSRVSLREMLYPLMQGYDSVAVKADVELGGTDQRFNLLAGRSLQQHYGQKPQDILMTTLISGLDGRKMSSSWGNTIAITAEPDDMYGKIMSLRDEFIEQYFVSCTQVPIEEVKSIVRGIEQEENPQNAKKRLAREITTLYHGKDVAVRAENEFVQTFSERGIPTEIPVVSVVHNTPLHDALISLVKSKSDLRRLVDEGAVHTIEGKKITDINTKVTEPMTLKIGKRRFVKIELE